MNALTPAEERRLATIVEGIETLTVDPLESALQDLCPLLDLEVWGFYTLQEYTTGWKIARCVFTGMPSLRDGLARLFDKPMTNEAPVFYDVSAPPRTQRNRLVEATEMIKRAHPDAWRESNLYRELLKPFGVADRQQHRILMCEDASLLGWFGTLHDGPLSVHQRRLLRAVAQPLRKRLLVERRLADTPRVLAALDAAIDEIATAAFIVGEAGQIRFANREGRRALAGGNSDVRTGLQDALAGRASLLKFDITPLRETGAPPHWLAIARPPAETLIELAIARATQRWTLTPRQRDVLGRVIRGATNAAIAAELRVSARAIESHVTALLDRIGADSRAELTASVLAR